MGRGFRLLLLLAAMMVAIFEGDRIVAQLFKEQTLAPVLAILCLGALIFVGSPKLILAAIPLFALETYWLLKGLSAYPHIRTVSVVLGGLIALGACVLRRNLEARTAELDLILAKLQAPWILCDRSGNIRRMSTPAAELAKTSFQDLEGTSFFAHFSAGTPKGELIRKFLKTADSRIPMEKIFLSGIHNTVNSFNASFLPIQTREGLGILVTLSPA